MPLTNNSASGRVHELRAMAFYRKSHPNLVGQQQRSKWFWRGLA